MKSCIRVKDMMINCNNSKSKKASHKTKDKKLKVLGSKVIPEYTTKDEVKYEREVILKRDFYFRKEGANEYKKIYMDSMFYMLFLNKKDYHVKRNEMAQNNNLVYKSTTYSNIDNRANTPILNQKLLKNQRLTMINKRPSNGKINSFYNNKQISSLNTMSKSKENEINIRTTVIMDDDPYFSVDNELNVHDYDNDYNSYNKARIKLMNSLYKKYGFFKSKPIIPLYSLPTSLKLFKKQTQNSNKINILKEINMNPTENKFTDNSSQNITPRLWSKTGFYTSRS